MAGLYEPSATVKRIEHGGSVSGFRTLIRRFPDDRVCIIVLSNSTPADIDQLASDVEAIVLGQPSKGARKQPENGPHTPS